LKQPKQVAKEESMIETHQLHRRSFLTTAASGLGGIALLSLLDQDGVFADDTPRQVAGAQVMPLANRTPHFHAKAKRCIFLLMEGAPSQLDLFLHKPLLAELHGQPLPSSLTEGVRFAFLQKDTATVMAPNRRFARHGESGMWFSDLIPHLASQADDLCMIQTMQSDQFNHHPGQLMLQCGQAQFGLPTIGSWISYGLGTENQDLPSYVVLTNGRPSAGGPTLWQSGFLSSVHEGVPLRNEGPPILNLTNPPGLTSSLQRKSLDALRELNQQRFHRIHNPEVAARIANYELAFRMQAAAPQLTDLSLESASTLEEYGVNRPEPDVKSSRVASDKCFRTFALNCLLARRMVERGVRFVNIIFSSWDHHTLLEQDLTYSARAVDQPIAALLRDLKQRGLLDDTLVVWGSEFGRTPLGENRLGKEVTGRDHHPDAFTMWMAGGGARAGYTHGETDDIGWAPVSGAVHLNDFQATLLHLFGLDHLRLTYRYQGADQRLTNLTREAHVVHELMG
jgi:hypothetical protein